MTDNEKSIEDMKAELEAAGYRSKAGSEPTVIVWECPNGMQFTDTVTGDPSDVAVARQLTKRAYAHLQGRRELAELRGFVHGIWKHGTDYVEEIAGDLVSKYNITDESDNDV